MNFLNQLSESAVFRSEKAIDRYTLNDLSTLFYLYVLSTYLMMQEMSTVNFSQQYCSKTKAFNNFDFFRNSATDFYMLVFALSGKYEKYHANLEILRYQQISTRDFITFLSNVVFEVKSSWYQSYFFGLESKLKVSNSILRDTRRKILDWSKLQSKEKEKLIDILYTRIKLLAPSSELLDHLRKLMSEMHMCNLDMHHNEFDGIGKGLYESILVENRFDYLLKTYGEKLCHAYENDLSMPTLDENDRIKTYSNILKKLEKLDPTTNKQYLQWIVLRYISRNFRFEDGWRIKHALENFSKYKNRLTNKDINQYKGVADIEDAIDPFLDKPASKRQEKEIDKSQIEKLYEDENTILLIPKSEAAACFYGKNTRWCTAADENNMFDHYSKTGNLYILIDKKNNKKYQFHLESLQFMDEKDESIDPDILIKEYPEPMQRIITIWFEKAQNNSRLAHLYCVYVNNYKPVKELEPIIATDTDRSYYYARNILKGRFMQGEDSIAKSSDRALMYAVEIIKEPFPEGEPAIANSSSGSGYYLRFFPEREEIINELSRKRIQGFDY